MMVGRPFFCAPLEAEPFAASHPRSRTPTRTTRVSSDWRYPPALREGQLRRQRTSTDPSWQRKGLQWTPATPTLPTPPYTHPTTPRALLAGYLQKETAAGLWQKRWFEIVSHYLVYYKTKDDVRMLCAMDLWLVRCLQLRSCRAPVGHSFPWGHCSSRAWTRTRSAVLCGGDMPRWDTLTVVPRAPRAATAR
jgi:hypothetical protein